ncbi:MvdC/MvdD family ATP grasp protein [Streptomyces sp. NPDC086554]|uniref:MvdC/MvdD family ATP grasp protein n=1 Tax=Streptomyces sp. NPDC086554 TaxID=3154864 RepID=UPI003440BE7A
MTVLVVDSPFEAGTDLILGELASAGVPVFRMDTAQFPVELEFRATFGNGRWEGVVSDAYRSVLLSGIKAVYWNRPGTFQFSGLSEADENFARGAARIGFGGVLTSLEAPFMNHPSKASAAEFKPRQLQVASAAGLTVPRSLVTTDAQAVRRFAKLVDAPIITKPLGIPVVSHEAGYEQMYTRVVDLGSLSGVSMTAHLFQEQVEKDFEVRLIFVGNECHSARIDAGSEQALIDWRTDYDSLTVAPIATPCAIENAMKRYAAVMDLAYFAADFIVRPSGEWVFLEANPSGQWAWANSPDLPLAAAISRTLEDWCHT